MANGRSEDFRTPLCRLSYAQGLFKPRQAPGEDNAKLKFGATLIFPKTTDRRELDEAVRTALLGEWGQKGLQMAKDGLIKSPFLDGNGPAARSKDTGDLHAGMGPDVFFIRATANLDRPPMVLYRSAAVPATPEEVYSGCYGHAVLNAFAWSNPKGGKGVSFGIRMFQKISDGETLGGGGPVQSEKWFVPIPDEPVPEAALTGDGAGGLFS